jgi:hypothetical protein
MERSVIVNTNKQLALIVKCGPAFSGNEVDQAHAALDLAGIPTEHSGHRLTLTERISWMHGELNQARANITTIEGRV